MIYNLFPTGVYVNAFPNIDNSILENFIKSASVNLEETEWSAKDGMTNENYPRLHKLKEVRYTENGITSFYSKTYSKLQDFEEFDTLILAINDATTSYFEEVRHFQNLIQFLKIGSMWYNINNKGSYHASHIHKNSYLSGVYYVKASSKSAPIVFEDPRTAQRMYEVGGAVDSPYLCDTKEFFPEAGKLVLFPSWLRHRVDQQLEDDERISISFNIDFDYRELTEYENKVTEESSEDSMPFIYNFHDKGKEETNSEN